MDVRKTRLCGARTGNNVDFESAFKQVSRYCFLLEIRRVAAALAACSERRKSQGCAKCNRATHGSPYSGTCFTRSDRRGPRRRRSVSMPGGPGCPLRRRRHRVTAPARAHFSERRLKTPGGPPTSTWCQDMSKLGWGLVLFSPCAAVWREDQYGGGPLEAKSSTRFGLSCEHPGRRAARGPSKDKNMVRGQVSCLSGKRSHAGGTREEKKKKRFTVTFESFDSKSDASS